MNKKTFLKLIDKRIALYKKSLRRDDLWYLDKYAWNTAISELRMLRMELKRMK